LRDLLRLYPEGALYRYDAAIDGKDFMMYFVPPAEGGLQNAAP
jgi:hypothetical protein